MKAAGKMEEVTQAAVNPKKPTGQQMGRGRQGQLNKADDKLHTVELTLFSNNNSACRNWWKGQEGWQSLQKQVL